MEDKDKAAFKSEIKAFLYLTNGTTSPTDAVIAGYWRALESYPLERVTKTLQAITSAEDGHHSPAKVVSILTGKTISSAQKDFAHLLDLLKRHGVADARLNVDLESKGWKTLASVGGFKALNVSANDLSNVRSAFYAAYEGAKK